MIEDTLKRNPGMKETYRAYARKMYVEARIESLLKKRTSANAETVKEIDGLLAKYRAGLIAAEAEIERCKKVESGLLEEKKTLKTSPALSVK